MCLSLEIKAKKKFAKSFTKSSTKWFTKSFTEMLVFMLCFTGKTLVFVFVFMVVAMVMVVAMFEVGSAAYEPTYLCNSLEIKVGMLLCLCSEAAAYGTKIR